MRACPSSRDPGTAARRIREAGYGGEKVVLLASTDIASNSLSSEVVADVMKRIGLNVDLQAMDWGTVVQRRGSRQLIDKGGWSAFVVRFDGATLLNPAVALITRGNGEGAWFGWPRIPALEELYNRWLDAPDLDAQKATCRDIQATMWQEAPAFPLGQVLLPTAFSRRLTGVLDGFPKFYGVAKA